MLVFLRRCSLSRRICQVKTLPSLSPSGSGPTRRKKSIFGTSSVGSRRIQPNLRWSLKNKRLPSPNVSVTLVDLSGSWPIRLALGWPAPNRSRPSSLRKTNWPVIFKWMTKLYSLENSISRTFARRVTSTTLAPTRKAATSSGAFGKPFGQSKSTDKTCLPGSKRCRPIRTVSTSGSSGIPLLLQNSFYSVEFTNKEITGSYVVWFFRPIECLGI